jgi:hypothetical protein
VEDAQVSLPSPDYGTPRVMASESSADQTISFESRWASVELLQVLNSTQSLGSALILNRDESAPGVAESEAVQPEMTDSEQMFRLLGIALMSVGIALGLYAVIGGSVAALRRARRRAAVSRSRESMVVVRSAPSLDSSISDILERLSREDEELRASSQTGERDASQNESDHVGHSPSRALLDHHASLAGDDWQVSRNRR